MTLIGGRIYAGYGDYTANTGPIHLESVPAASPLDAWTDHVVADSEQIGLYRPLESGGIAAPAIDPRTNINGGFTYRAPGGTWTDLSQVIPDAEHVFDIVEFDGATWACGSDFNPSTGGAAIWRSTDEGATWAKSLEGPRDGDVTLHRFYCFVVVGGVLRVREPISGTSYKWNGSAWITDTVNPLPSL